MRSTLAITVVVAAGLAGGCRSGAWRWGTTGDMGGDVRGEVADLPSPAAHRAVENVTLRTHGREFHFVGYRASNAHGAAVRAQLVLESGVSVLDVAVRAGESRRLSGSVFEAIPHFAETAMDDLRRVWGPASAVAAKRALEIVGSRGVSSGSVTDGRTNAFAIGVERCVVLLPTGGEDRLEVLVLDADLVPEARIAYADFDEDGIPREIRLTDLRREHTLDIEVEEVQLVDDPVPASTFETGTSVP